MLKQSINISGDKYNAFIHAWAKDEDQLLDEILNEVKLWVTQKKEWLKHHGRSNREKA